MATKQGLNRTLRWLRRTRETQWPELFAYDPDDSPAPAGVRFMTLAESRELECNRCGQCCGSAEADTGGDLKLYIFGGIPEDQWSTYNKRQPLIIPLTPSGRDRKWRPADEDLDTAPPFRCDALLHFDDGTTGCRLWQSRRPRPCNTFPVYEPAHERDLRAGAYVLLNTKFQRHCTWVDTMLCPEDSIFLEWRRGDGTLRSRLAAEQRAYVDRVFADAYRDAYRLHDPLPNREWRRIRNAEDAWRRAVPSPRVTAPDSGSLQTRGGTA